MLVHPSRPELIRLFTVGEHARIKSVPEELVKGMNATRGHEALGQGICYAPFYAVGKAVADALIAWKHTGFILRKLINKEDVVLVEPVASVQLCLL
jgi:hypothetical protein